MIRRFSFWVVGADGLSWSGRARSAGRVLGGGLTVSVRVAVEVDETEGMDGETGCAEEGGRSWVLGPLVVWLRRV